MSLNALRADASSCENRGGDRLGSTGGAQVVEPDAVDHLYRHETSRLARYFARRIGPDDAPDLVQDCFVRLASLGSQGIRRLRQPEAYLTRIAGNLLRDRAKIAARRSTALHLSADDVPLVGADLQAQLEARDMLDRLETAMLRLPPRTREIFMAHRLDGLTYPEIADRTGLTVSGVEQQISRALADLRHWLGPL